MTSKGQILMNCVNVIILFLSWHVSCFFGTIWFSLRRWNVLWIYLVYFLLNISPTSSHLWLFLTVHSSKIWLSSVKFFSWNIYKTLGHHSIDIKVIRKRHILLILHQCWLYLLAWPACFMEILWKININSEGQKKLL